MAIKRVNRNMGKLSQNDELKLLEIEQLYNKFKAGQLTLEEYNSLLFKKGYISLDI